MIERILIAAIWYKDIPLKKDIPAVRPKNINKGIVILGHRHGQCIWTTACLTGLRTVTNAEDAAGTHVQGFLTNKNRFVSRMLGAKIAFKAGQIKKEIATLYSEDLY
jgi:hypothetical protein